MKCANCDGSVEDYASEEIKCSVDVYSLRCVNTGTIFVVPRANTGPSDARRSAVRHTSSKPFHLI